MSAFLSVDPDTRIIDITKVPVGGLTSLDVQIDIYSDLKEDWQSIPTLQGLRFPLRSFGDPKSPTQDIGPYMFVRNQDGWRFRAYDLDHELSLLGNLIPEDVTKPVFLGRAGRTIVITQDQSNQAITVADPLGTEIVEGSYSMRSVLRLMLAALSGKLSGAGTGTVSIRDSGDSRDRIVATTDALGNRTSVVLDDAD